MNKPEYPSNEYELLAAVKKALGPSAAPGGAYELTLGDDAAIRRAGKNERLIFTTDIAVENVHFSREAMTFREIGFRTMAANVSDCAAMAALPEAALVDLVFPRSDARLMNKAVDLYRGFAEACRKWNFRIVGGDCAAGPCWTLGVTLIGSAPRKHRLLRRTGIRAGDRLWVSGFPGLSAAGFAALEKWGRNSVPAEYRRLVRRHIRPCPQPDLGVMLGRCKEVRAAMDLSDGISKDARTLCFENNLGLEIALDPLAPPTDMVSLARRLTVPWTEWFFHGGEEYSLLFAASASFDPRVLPGRYRARMTPLGFFSGRDRKILVRRGRRVGELRRGGWDHVSKSLRPKG